MKTLLLYATLIFFVLGTSFAHEVAISPAITSHKTVIEHRVVQLNPKLGVECTTSYTTVVADGVKGASHKSVDCEE